AHVRRTCGVLSRAADAGAGRADENGTLEVARRAHLYRPRTSAVHPRRLSSPGTAHGAAKVALHRLEAQRLRADDGSCCEAHRRERFAIRCRAQTFTALG